MTKKLLLLLASSTALAACSLAPDWALPDMKPPENFKETNAEAEKKGVWAPAESLEKASRGEWWLIFGDPALNALQQKAMEANPTLAAAAARVQAARATVTANASSLLPNVDLGANAVRSQPSSASAAAFGAPPSDLKPYTIYSAQGTLSYEADLFGRVRDQEKAFRFEAEGEEALYRSTLLALQGDVAQNYFTLLAIDTERQLLQDTLVVREEAARIMQKRMDAGFVSEQEVARTKAELLATQAELTAATLERATFEHALATLLGTLPSDFTLAEGRLSGAPPLVPSGIPSQLLLRRPDVAAAASVMAAANARIGVARTAYFPTLILTASGGFESPDLGSLFEWSSRTWALGQLAGTALVWNIFDSGRTTARVDVAKSRYDETVARYREQALMAFRDVEGALAGQRLLAQQSEQLEAAAAAAKRTTDLTQKRYDSGDANYFEVVDAQRTSLAAERSAVRARSQRFIMAVRLVRALGGGWETPVAEEADASDASKPVTTEPTPVQTEPTAGDQDQAPETGAAAAVTP